MNKIIKLCLPVGLLIYVIYRIVDYNVTIPDRIAIPMAIISIVLMLIGVAYESWKFARQIKTK